MQTSHSRRTYDYRIQEAICETGDRDLFSDLEIPRSTVRSWIHRGVPDVVTSDLVARDRADLLAEIHQLHHRTALLGAVVGLLIAMLRVSKVQLDYERIPDGDEEVDAPCRVPEANMGDDGSCDGRGGAPVHVLVARS